MDALIELIKVLNRKRLSKIDVFDKTFLNQNNSNLYYKLYEGLESGKITDDASAAKYLYGSDEKDAKFRKLKSRFKDKILKTILLFDSDEVFNNEQGIAFYQCMTHNHTIDIINKLTGTSKLMFELVKENYSIAQKYGFYEILKNYSYYLLSYYGLKGDKKSFMQEEINYLRFSDYALKEQSAKFLYFKSIVEFSGSAPITNELLVQVKSNIDQLLEIRLFLKNPEIDFYYFFIALIYFENNNELDNILRICDEAESIMTYKPNIVTNTRQTGILIYRMKAFLYLKKYDDGILLMNKIADSTIVIPDSYYNWFIVKEIEYKLSLQNHNINHAYSVYEQVLNNKSLKRQVEQLAEKWKIYHAYLVFLDNYLNKGDYKKFSLPKFLNSVPVNSKDKSGFNFAIRIIELLFQFARGEDAMVFHKMDALRVYRSRYLNDNTYKRNHLFLSLLLKSEKSGFDFKVLQKAEWQEIQDLRDRKHIIAEWEIIPYEELWDIFVELSKK